MITNEQIEKLQNLASLQLSMEEKEEFKESLSSIVSYLNKLQDIDVTESANNEGLTWNYIVPREWLVNCDDTDALLANVEHSIIANSIAIKTFVAKE